MLLVKTEGGLRRLWGYVHAFLNGGFDPAVIERFGVDVSGSSGVVLAVREGSFRVTIVNCWMLLKLQRVNFAALVM